MTYLKLIAVCISVSLNFYAYERSLFLIEHNHMIYFIKHGNHGYIGVRNVLLFKFPLINDNLLHFVSIFLVKCITLMSCMASLMSF